MWRKTQRKERPSKTRKGKEVGNNRMDRKKKQGKDGYSLFGKLTILTHHALKHGAFRRKAIKRREKPERLFSW